MNPVNNPESMVPLLDIYLDVYGPGAERLLVGQNHRVFKFWVKSEGLT